MFCKVIGYADQCFAAKAEAFLFHGCSHHLIRFACTYHMAQQGVLAIQDMGDGVALVRAQSDFGIHTMKLNVAAVILSGAGTVEFFVVEFNQCLPPVLVFPDPLFESIFDLL